MAVPALSEYMLANSLPVASGALAVGSLLEAASLYEAAKDELSEPRDYYTFSLLGKVGWYAATSFVLLFLSSDPVSPSLATAAVAFSSLPPLYLDLSNLKEKKYTKILE